MAVFVRSLALFVSLRSGISGKVIRVDAPARLYTYMSVCVSVLLCVCVCVAVSGTARCAGLICVACVAQVEKLTDKLASLTSSWVYCKFI